MRRAVWIITLIGILVAVLIIGAISWTRFVSLDRQKGDRLNLEAYEAAQAGDDSIKKLDAALQHRLGRKNRAIAYYNRGIAENRKWRFDDAIRDHTKALSLDPKYAHAYIGRSYAYYHRGELTQAIKDLDVAVMLDPNSYDAHFNRATMFFHERQFDRALNDLEEAIRCDPNNAQPFFLCGICYAAIDDLDHALASFDAAIFMDPKNAMAYMQRSLLYHRKGEREKALNDHNRADQLDPEVWKKSTDLLVALASGRPESPVAAVWSKYGSAEPSVAFRDAMEASNMGDHDRAIGLYNLVLQLDITVPVASVAVMNRGNEYRVKGDMQRALLDYDQALRLNPANAGAYVNRAVVLAAQGRHEDALKDYDEAIRLNPEQWEAYVNRGADFRELERLDEAFRDFETVIKLRPQVANGYLGRASVYGLRHEFDKAGSDYERAIEIDPNSAEGYFGRAQTYIDRHRYSEALPDLEKAAQLNTRQPADGLNSLGWFQATCSDSRVRNGMKAIEVATKACELTKWQNAGHIDTLAAAYAEAGDFDNAIKFQKQVLKMTESTDPNRKSMEARLRLYERHHPYREKPDE